MNHPNNHPENMVDVVFSEYAEIKHVIVGGVDIAQWVTAINLNSVAGGRGHSLTVTFPVVNIRRAD